MGISYPYLAILSTMAFIAVIISTALVYLYIVDQVNRVPVVGVYAESYVEETGVVVIINIRHERGRPVELLRIQLFPGEEQVIVEDFSSSNIVVEGCQGKKVPVGGLCKIVLKFPQGVFEENETYQGLVFLTEGTYPVAFTPIRAQEIYPCSCTYTPVTY